MNELRAAVVLIKHFTHLLPQCPNPETALLHFREFLAQLFEQPDWLDSLASLHQPEVLETLSRLMGMSEFLWADFLKLQHRNLFPVVTDITALKQRKTLDDLTRELDGRLAAAETFEARRARAQSVQGSRDAAGRPAAHHRTPSRTLLSSPAS